MLREALDYDPETGTIVWKKKIARKVVVGKVAGSLCKITGYRIIRINSMFFRAHRIAWAMMTGRWPKYDIDHEDTNRSNNVWSNLREANHSQNQWNRGPSKNNTSGYKGVSLCKKSGKWIAQIGIGKNTRIGCFTTPEEAHEAYAGVAMKLRGGFARTS